MDRMVNSIFLALALFGLAVNLIGLIFLMATGLRFLIGNIISIL